MKQGIDDVPTMEEWLKIELKAGSRSLKMFYQQKILLKKNYSKMVKYFIVLSHVLRTFRWSRPVINRCSKMVRLEERII